MLDVHAPHKSDHTWTDFFIHIATICVGLLIAIGLEQSVEWVHHRHQRHQLEEDLHAEMRMNNEYPRPRFRLPDRDARLGREPGAGNTDRHRHPHHLTSRLSTTASQLRSLRPAQRLRLATRQRERHRQSSSPRRGSELHPALPFSQPPVRHLQAALRRALRRHRLWPQILLRPQPAA